MSPSQTSGRRPFLVLSALFLLANVPQIEVGQLGDDSRVALLSLQQRDRFWLRDRYLAAWP